MLSALRHALRSLRRTPVFTGATTSTLVQALRAGYRRHRLL